MITPPPHSNLMPPQWLMGREEITNIKRKNRKEKRTRTLESERENVELLKLGKCKQKLREE